VKADAVASHLLQVARAPVNKKYKSRVQVEWRYFLRHAPAFTVDEIYQALQNMKAGTAPGYDHVHPEFLENLGPRAQTWLSRFFSRIIIANAIPKTWRKTKVIAKEKPGKDPRLAESYRPISLLSKCYKLLERLVLDRVSPEVEKLLSPEQAGFRRNRSTCEQVAALTTHIENGFPNIWNGTMNNIKCVVHDDLGRKNRTTRYNRFCWLQSITIRRHSLSI